MALAIMQLVRSWVVVHCVGEEEEEGGNESARESRGPGVGGELGALSEEERAFLSSDQSQPIFVDEVRKGECLRGRWVHSNLHVPNN
jgi:hypothetical protein